MVVSRATTGARALIAACTSSETRKNGLNTEEARRWVMVTFTMSQAFLRHFLKAEKFMVGIQCGVTSISLCMIDTNGVRSYGINTGLYDKYLTLSRYLMYYLSVSIIFVRTDSPTALVIYFFDNSKGHSSNRGA